VGAGEEVGAGGGNEDAWPAVEGRTRDGSDMLYIIKYAAGHVTAAPAFWRGRSSYAMDNWHFEM
jgi:hypothetical protein